MNSPTTVLYDGTCGFCTQCRRIAERLDWLSALDWLPSQTSGVERFGIPQDLLQSRMHVVRGSQTWSGFAACKQILLRLPITYLLLIPWLVLQLPITASLGERAYDWVARNRYRIPGSTCERSN